MKVKIDSNICRVCLKSGEGEALFNDSGLAEKFMFCTQLKPSKDDSLPQTLCSKCVARLKIAYDFKLQSEKSEKHLKNFLQAVNSQFNQLVCQEVTTSSEEPSIVYSEPPSAVSLAVNLPLETKRNVQGPKETILVVQETPEKMPLVAKDESDVEEEEAEEGEEEQEHYEIEEGQMEIETYQEQQVIYVSEQEAFAITQISSKDVSADLSSVSAIAPEKKAESSVVESVVKVSESGKKHFICVKCDKAFSTKTNLWRHALSHDGQKPYICTHCNRGFTQNGSLKQHLLLHTGIKPHVCNVCERGFTQAKSLTFHMRRHTGEKPFICHCGLSFRQKDGLKRHTLVKHGERYEESLICDACNELCTSKNALIRHQKRHQSKQQQESEQQEANEQESMEESK